LIVQIKYSLLFAFEIDIAIEIDIVISSITIKLLTYYTFKLFIQLNFQQI